MTRQIHDAGFFHNDLVWRNILVTWQPPEKPILWWIDCPRGRFVFRKLSRRRRRLKDLALLDKSASNFCTRKERLAFVKEYLGKKGLDDEMKDLICRTVAYDRKRWPKDADES
jgi:hypothetical protein